GVATVVSAAGTLLPVSVILSCDLQPIAPSEPTIIVTATSTLAFSFMTTVLLVSSAFHESTEQPSGQPSGHDSVEDFRGARVTLPEIGRRPAQRASPRSVTTA